MFKLASDKVSGDSPVESVFGYGHCPCHGIIFPHGDTIHAWNYCQVSSCQSSSVVPSANVASTCTRTVMLTVL